MRTLAAAIFLLAFTMDLGAENWALPMSAFKTASSNVGGYGGISGGVSSQTGTNRALATVGKPALISIDKPFFCGSDEGVLYQSPYK